MGDQSQQVKPPAQPAEGTPAAPVPKQPPAAPQSPAAPQAGKEKAATSPVPPPKAQDLPATKAKPKAEAELQESPPTVPPVRPAVPSTPPTVPKREPKTTWESAPAVGPLPEVGQRGAEWLKWPRGTTPAARSPETLEENHQMGLAGLVAAQPPAPSAQPAAQAIRQTAHLAPASGRAIPALEGFCPVELVRNERWVAGDPRYPAEYRGRIYFLSGPAQQQEFLANPERYVPCHSGIDPVTLLEGAPRPGQTDYCAVYDGRLYMFSSPDTLARFRQDPRRYASQLAHGGR